MSHECAFKHRPPSKSFQWGQNGHSIVLFVNTGGGAQYSFEVNCGHTQTGQRNEEASHYDVNGMFTRLVSDFRRRVGRCGGPQEQGTSSIASSDVVFNTFGYPIERNTQRKLGSYPKSSGAGDDELTTSGVTRVLSRRRHAQKPLISTS